tara:strand:- start:32 stop:511 length:480 start_codon:yes stop_codon:yes gene_type:complete
MKKNPEQKRYSGFIGFNFLNQNLGLGGTYGSNKKNIKQTLDDKGVKVLLDRDIKSIEKGLKLKVNKINLDYNKIKTAITGMVDVPEFGYRGGLDPQMYKQSNLNIGITGLNIAGGVVTANVGRRTQTGMPDEHYGDIKFRVPLSGTKKIKRKKNNSYNY